MGSSSSNSSTITSSNTTLSNNTTTDTANKGFVEIGHSFEAAIVAAIITGLLCTIHFLLLVRLRAWFFHLMLFSAFLECISLFCRALTTKGHFELLVVVLAYLLPIVLPSFMAAACYMVFGRLVRFVTPPERLRRSVLWIPPRWITPIFVTFDVFAFFIQFIGIGQVGAALNGDANNQKKADSGYAILKIGLIVQLACFGIFAVIGFRYALISRQWNPPPFPGLQRPWRQLLMVVNLSATLITLRSIYRIFEFTSASARIEWMFFVFEVIPLTVVFTTFLVIHPGHCLPRLFTHFRVKKLRLDPKLTVTHSHELGPYQSYK